MLKKYWWLFAVPVLILLSIVIFVLWQRDQIRNVQPPPPRQGLQMRSELFLADPVGETSESTASTATGTNTGVAPIQTSPWPDPRIPELILVTQKYSSLLARARGLLNLRFDRQANAPVAPPVELEDHFAQEITTTSGLKVVQLLDKQSGEITSERWNDSELGEVIRFYHPEYQSISLSAKPSGMQIDLISIPAEQVEYVTVKEADRGYVSISEGGRNSKYWANIGENRYVEYQDGRARQWQRIGENRFQEIDENGQRLSVYMVDPESREIVLAE